MTGDRVFALFNVLALQIAGLGVLLFWSIGAVFFITGQGGQFNHMEFSNIGRTLFFLYPVALAIFSLLGWFLFYIRRDLLAIMMLSAPVGLVVLYYLAVVFPTGARV